MRLLRDSRGNALAIMAASLIPVAAFAGAAIDVGRTYTVKTRLQQACDAGVLAGRKSMTDTTLDTSDTGQAQTFFKNNFPNGYFSSTNAKFTPSLTDDYQVQGTATATVPVTIMGMLGQKAQTLTVTCQARYDVADADIMFVLDTTGSMACTTASDTGSGCGAATATYMRPDGTTGYYAVEQAGSKLSGLRSAILSFYDTIASSVDTSTHIRYGFVPYSSTVNVGSSLPTNYLVSKWSYQSRVVIGDQAIDSTYSDQTFTGLKKSDCYAKESRSPSGPGPSGNGFAYNTDGTATTVKVQSWSVTGNGADPAGTCVMRTQRQKPKWGYNQYAWDVSQFVQGQSVIDPTKVTGAKSRWQGCIEERTTTASSYFNTNNLPPDLNPDLIPAAEVDSNGLPTSRDTRWRPMWPEVSYFRNQIGADSNSGASTNPYGDTTSTSALGAYTSLGSPANMGAGYATCGKAAQRLRTMTRSEVSNYVNASDFKALGGTYHDTGMIWGTRFLAPNGPFANDTAAWPGRQAPNRYIVFMTDGQMAPNLYLYGMYGMEAWDQRVTGGAYGSQTDYHNARFVAECQAARARGITVFVVGFGQTLNDQLKACASPGQAYYASDNDALKSAFQRIAAQVAMLRISK